MKDILAFANAWRRSDAFILIGVDEIRGGQSQVVGVNNHLDDAKLQQFVNSKTQRPVHFSYQEVQVDEMAVGIIHIPPQERPIYLTKRYGRLDKEVVYIRRGTTTSIATPDEIASMGRPAIDLLSAVPRVELQIFDASDLQPLGPNIRRNTVNLSVPDSAEIPDYGLIRFPVGLNSYSAIPGFDKNRDFYRDVADYFKKTLETTRVEFIVTNVGDVLAEDVRVEATIEDPTDMLILGDAARIPNEPSRSFSIAHDIGLIRDLDIRVQRSRKNWHISAKLGKVQPKGFATTSDGLFIGSKVSTTISLIAKVFADNLPAPRDYTLTIEIEPKTQSLSVDQIIELTERKEDKVSQ